MVMAKKAISEKDLLRRFSRKTNARILPGEGQDITDQYVNDLNWAFRDMLELMGGNVSVDPDTIQSQRTAG